MHFLHEFFFIASLRLWYSFGERNANQNVTNLKKVSTFFYIKLRSKNWKNFKCAINKHITVSILHCQYSWTLDDIFRSSRTRKIYKIFFKANELIPSLAPVGIIKLSHGGTPELGKPQKSSFLSCRATKRGGGLNGCATKEKSTFFNVRKKSSYGH